MRNNRPASLAICRVACASLVLSFATAWLPAVAARAGETPPGSPPNPVMHLTNGGSVQGTFQDSDQAGMIRWQSPRFVSPFDFAVSGVNAIHYSLLPDSPKPKGDYRFELAGGDVQFGSLIELNEKDAELDVPRIGRLHIERDKIHRIDRWRDIAHLTYLGPNGLTGWQETATKDAWREESGHLLTEQEFTTVRNEVGIPGRAIIDFEISWKNKPDFILALGVDKDEKVVVPAFRFEAWSRALVVLRETARDSDLSSIVQLGPGPGRVHLLAYVDQERGRIVVFSSSGKQLADLTVSEPNPKVLSGIDLVNKRGDVRLERLRISPWNSEPPIGVDEQKPRIHCADGSIVYGRITRFDAATKEFVVQGDSGESRVQEDQIATAVTSLPNGEQPRMIRAIYQDGALFSGELLKVQNGDLWMSLPGVEQPLRLPTAGLRSLIVTRPELTAPARDELVGMLELDGVRLQGRLVEGREQSESNCLTWQPQGSASSSPLGPRVSGRIVYKESPQATDPQAAAPGATRGGLAQVMIAPAAPAQRVAQRPAPAPAVAVRDIQGRVVVMNGRVVAAGNAPAPQPQPPATRGLYLRSGDIIPCDVTKIDETGVWFRTPISDSTFVSNEKVKAVELAPDSPPMIRLNKIKRERLLTLPRMQKENPPTHLICSVNGDFLRGRVVGMDDKKLMVEVHLETKEVLRGRIARIIWFSADELDGSKPAAKPADGIVGTRVHALRSDGIRMTFFAEQFGDTTLSGKSEVLGACRVRLNDVDQILIGDAIEQAAALLAHQQWKLKNATEPKVSQSDSQTERPPGTEAALVGKPAPDFELELLDGKKFHLAEMKGKIVVLDFWATWCGPCIQAMPQVDRVTQEFQDRGVKLVAVNLQERPKQISDMLDRHKLRMTVALDVDGVVANKYGATAIPQTVIIDRDGAIVRLFVGGGPNLGDQLRDALSSVLGDNNKEEGK